MEETKKKSYVLETEEYPKTLVYDPSICIKPIITKCIYTPFTENCTCKHCYKNIQGCPINKIRRSPILIETEPTHNNQSCNSNKTIRQSPVLVDYKFFDTD